jgi:hypothetical protein
MASRHRAFGRRSVSIAVQGPSDGTFDEEWDEVADSRWAKPGECRADELVDLLLVVAVLDEVVA